jgi:hypothetical protein
MTTAQELAENIGKTAHLNVAGSRLLKFNVVILDARKRYGKLDYKVTPVAGEGETWHEESQLTFYP